MRITPRPRTKFLFSKPVSIAAKRWFWEFCVWYLFAVCGFFCCWFFFGWARRWVGFLLLFFFFFWCFCFGFCLFLLVVCVLVFCLFVLKGEGEKLYLMVQKWFLFECFIQRLGKHLNSTWLSALDTVRFHILI